MRWEKRKGKRGEGRGGGEGEERKERGGEEGKERKEERKERCGGEEERRGIIHHQTPFRFHLENHPHYSSCESHSN